MKKVIKLISSLKLSKILNLLPFVLVVAAIPLTVFIAGQNQNLKQEAQMKTLATADSPEIIKPPNILFILTDDLDSSSIKYMSNLKKYLIDEGASFSRYYISSTLCCPSRATILRGQYSHNTQVLNNSSPYGGYSKFYETGNENSTIATWLKDAGYSTAFFGKYFNKFPEAASLAKTYIPPGWTEWYGAVGYGYDNINYTLNENGALVSYADKPEDYLTDVIASKTNDFMKKNIENGKPFFAYVSTYSPHTPANPAQRHKGQTFSSEMAPRPPSFNESDVSDKPKSMQLPLLTKKQISKLDFLYRKRLRSLQSVDEMIASFVNTLASSSALNNTYIVFSSDNGYHFGLHRFTHGKSTAYEEDTLVPLIIRGPDVLKNYTIDQMAGNVDLAPTFAKLANIAVPDFVDGRSLVPLFSGPQANWRLAYLLERKYPSPTSGLTKTDIVMDEADSTTEEDYPPGSVPTFNAIRTKRNPSLKREFLYVEYETGEKELYNMIKDPYQLDNIYSTIATTEAQLVNKLSTRIQELKTCAGATCREIEQRPF